MLLELWTLKTRGPNIDQFTFWKKCYGDVVPEPGREFYYETKTGKQKRFKVSHIDYLVKFGKLRIQVCLKRPEKNV